MTMSTIFNVQTGNATVFVNGRSYVFNNNHPNYEGLLKALDDDNENDFVRLVDIPKAVNNFTNGRITVKDGVVYFKGKPIHNTMADRLLAVMNKGLPAGPTIKYLDNLMDNPDMHSVNESYDFLARNGIPITHDGCLLAYKRVRDDWKDIHSGTVESQVGTTVEVERNTVNPDWRLDCSSGLHVGSLDYVRNFGSGGHVLIVKVNPKDIVSVPESETNKMRVCRYEVIGELDQNNLNYVGQEYVTHPEFDPVDDEDKDDSDLETWEDSDLENEEDQLHY